MTKRIQRPPNKKGRPSTFTEAMADRICAHIAEGGSLKAFCRENEDAPLYVTIMWWLREKPDFLMNYASAREAQGDADADEIADVAKKVERGDLDPNAGRVVIDALKWSAGKRKPKSYGDRLEVVARVSLEHLVNASFKAG